MAKESTDGVRYRIPQTEGLHIYAFDAPRTLFITQREYAALAATEAGIDHKKFQELIDCESTWKEDALGDKGTSFGILQFKKTTFAEFSARYGLVGADINDSTMQIELASLMIRDGYLFHWKNCARKIGWRA